MTLRLSRVFVQRTWAGPNLPAGYDTTYMGWAFGGPLVGL